MRIRLALAPLALFLSTTVGADPGSVASPGSHLWVVNEVFSNATGSIQFIELEECCGSGFELGLSGKSIFSDATGNSFTFPNDLTGNTAFRNLLLATADFASLPGAPTPDFILPDGFFDVTGDTIRWHIYVPATLTFGPGQLPLDGVSSLAQNGTVAVNSPTNYAGSQGSVNLGGAVPLPVWANVALAVLVLGLGVRLLRPRSRKLATAS